MNISLIIPNYNGAKLLEKNLPKVLEAVKAYKNGSVEIIVADDASIDDSGTVIEAFIASIKDKHIKAIFLHNTNRKNGGFSKNVNRGARAAIGEVLILLNSDIVPKRDFLSPLLSHFADPYIFAVGCMDESIEDGKTVLRGRGIGKWKKGFLMHSAGNLDHANTLWVSGGSGAFRKSMWDKLGGLNELYNPFYWEDIDISYRAQKAGWKILFEKKSVVIHEHSKGSIKTQYKNTLIQKIAYRNQFIFVWENIRDKDLLLSHILWLPYHLLNAVKSGNKAFLLGFLSAVTYLPKVLSFRKKMKKMFVRKDSAILAEFTS